MPKEGEILLDTMRPAARDDFPSNASGAERPILYDMTLLVRHLRKRTGTGIDRVDLAFAKRFCAEAVHYHLGGPRVIPSTWARRFLAAAEQVWTKETPGRASGLFTWLATETGAPFQRPRPPSRRDRHAWRRRWLSWCGKVVGNGRIPKRAIYLNVGFHRFGAARLFRWLDRRTDVDAVFMIHDLLPLDHPEYFPPGESRKFDLRLRTALRFGRAFLVSTRAVQARLEAEMAARKLPPRPIWAAPFPSPLHSVSPAPTPPALPYFVTIGTIEPRKNHLMLLHLWREWALGPDKPPRLVIVGARGWENEQTLAMLDRSRGLAPYVAEISDLGAEDLAKLIAGARGLLAPSFDEGYGLPIVEALSLGTPVVAADTPAIREVSQGCATHLSAIDALGWRREIASLAADAAHHQAMRRRAQSFVAPNWPDYFRSLNRFLRAL